ncbi:MAG TPA: phosphate ABC transporter permease PstA [Gemmatimonadaceae bacterium]|nr:phosphate ABC transporter permease PstA [Gemmatimonadaceae bacterium]
MTAPVTRPPSGGVEPRREPPRPRSTVRQRAAAERTMRTLRRRRIVSRVMVGVMYLAAFLTTLPLLLILFHLFREGAQALSPAFFTEMPAPPGMAGGGMANAIVGTLILIALASVVGLPVGIGAGLYLAERRATKLATVTRFLSDVLNGLPSIIMGIFAWQMLVRPLGGFSAISAGVALGVMMIPLVTRATEEMIRLVPISLREAALALGYSQARTSLTIVLRTALPGIVTGALVAVARIAGETAPLLFTAFGNQFWSVSLTGAIDALPLRVFYYATAPYDEQNALAWAGALVLIGLVLVISLGARYVTRSRFGRGGD